MTTSHAPTLQPSWRRAALAFLAGAALVLGMAVPHDMAAEQAGAAKVEIAESAVHPHSPAHFEDGEFKIHPPCVACLLQAQAGTVLCPPPAAQKPLAREAGTPLQPRLHASEETPLTGPARAPPSLSLLSA
ncbi:MAG TPA: hypothetical protein VIJ26_06980 [Thermoanaerobaculia bacterium]